MSGCRRVRPWIVRSVDQDLTPSEALRLARHISTCTACRILLARETRLSAVLHEMSDACAVDESFFRNVMASLPERSATVPRQPGRRGLRRGLKLATWVTLTAAAAGLAGRVLPSLRFDLGAPSFPRFSPDETDRWMSVLGAAAQWARMTAQSMAWAGSSSTVGPWSTGVLSFGTALLAVAALIGISGALAWATRIGSRAS